MSGARPDGGLLRTIGPDRPGVSLLPWVRDQRRELREELGTRGAVLLRGFGPISAEALEQVVTAVSGQLLEYTHRSTPRSRVSGRIFTSTEYPADQTIPQHNEMSYTRSWPGTLFFACIEAAETGGETPISDSRAVYRRLSPGLRERFEQRGVMYVRNFHPRVGLPWQDVFQTADQAEVEDYCRRMDIQVEWRPRGRLRTVQVCQAVTTHPGTRETVWFNQAHLFHVSNLEPRVRDSVLKMFGPEDLPRNSLYGDGTPIEDDALDEIRAAYAAEEVAFPWQEGDVMMIDNVLTAHGRRPFTGSRSIVVGMAPVDPA